jgi:hypothetical protein
LASGFSPGAEPLRRAAGDQLRETTEELRMVTRALTIPQIS